MVATGNIQQRFESTLVYLANHNISTSDFVIVGSSALYYTGILRAHSRDYPSDIDVLLTNPDKFEDLKRAFPSTAHHTNGVLGTTIDIKTPDLLPIEITREWPTHYLNLSDIVNHCIDRNGLRVMNPQDSKISMMEFDRPKDQARLAVINDLDNTIHLEML